ncbi:protein DETOXIFICATION 27 [Citrus sinensis]|nr:protein DETOXIFICATION 27 [Citrus sinensis]
MEKHATQYDFIVAAVTLEDLASTVPSQDDSDQSLTRKFWTESKKLWHIVGPTIFNRVASYSLFVITQAFAGHLGDLELAAISIANNVVVALNYGLLPDDVAELFGMVSTWLIPLHFSFAFQFPLQTFLQSQLKTKVSSDMDWFFHGSVFWSLRVCKTLCCFWCHALRYINACNDMYPASWVRVSNELGAGNGKGARFATIVSVVTSIAIGLFFFILVLIFHNELALAFSSSEAVLQVVKKCRSSYHLPFCSTVFNQFSQGIWAGMIFGATAVQTLILATSLQCDATGIKSSDIDISHIITMRCDWNKETLILATSLQCDATQIKRRRKQARLQPARSAT